MLRCTAKPTRARAASVASSGWSSSSFISSDASGALLIAFISKETGAKVTSDYHYWLIATLALLLVAGMAGGLIGSSIPYHTTHKDFLNADLGPRSFKWIRASKCIHLEHAAFWLAAVNAAVGLVVATYRPPDNLCLIGPLVSAGAGAIAIITACVASIRIRNSEGREKNPRAN